MKLLDFLERKIQNVKISSSATISIDVPAEIYYKEMALYTASSCLENAIGMCEFKTMIKHKPVKTEDYYILNVAPNKNENSDYFWHKVVRKMIRNPEGALVVEIRGQLHCAESFSIKQNRPILGNIYDGVVLEGGLQLEKSFRADEVYLFRMEDANVRNLVDGIYHEHGKLLQAAARAFRDTNGRKFKLKVDGTKAGNEEFNEQFTNYISKNIKAYMENEYATYVEYEGEELVEESSEKTAKDIEDFIALRKDMFEIVGQALKVPNSLMTGNVTSVDDVCNVFLTFAVDPLADTITAVLNKRAGIKEYMKGNYYKCYTGRIKHRDLFDSAPNADKLIASSVANTDEVREELDLAPLNEPWSKQHYVTNNYSRIEDAAKAVNDTEGGTI